MLNALYSPSWFYDIDILIDIVSIIILLIIAYVSLQYRRLTQKTQHTLFATAFFLLAASFLFNILTNFELTRTVLAQRQLGEVTITYQAIQSFDTLTVIGTLLARLLMLFGLYALYSFYYQNQERTTIVLVSLLMLVTTYFSTSAYYIFHGTVSILLIFITISLYKNSKKTKDKPAHLVFLSFLTLALSQFFFIFTRLHQDFYVTGEIIQLIGYIILLTAFLKVIKYGKKKQA